jgi:cell surface protein SprA
VNRLDFLKNTLKLRSISVSHRFDYQDQHTVRPFQAAEDEWLNTIDFNPLVRVNLLTQNSWRIENSVRLKMEERERRAKMEVPGTSLWQEEYEEYYIKIPWIHVDMAVDRGYAVGDELSISKAIRTQRGIQFWRWYIKLDNDIDVRLASGYSYRKIIQENYAPVQGYDPGPVPDYYPDPAAGISGIHSVFAAPPSAEYPDGLILKSYTPELEKISRTIPVRSHEWYIRPSAGYQFNKIASASAYIEYRRLIEQLNDGNTHTRQSLSFEIAVLLRFN